MEGTSPARCLNISIDENKTEAYISILYVPDNQGQYPPKYTLEEIKTELFKAGVVFGIIDNNIKKALEENETSKVLAAKGKPPIDDEDDALELKFQVDSELKTLNEDINGNVDFKSIGSVNSVLKGNAIAMRIHGKKGTEGEDVSGKIIKPKKGKEIRLTAGSGCELLNENTITASIDGKPCMKNNVFHVYKTHELSQDVDLITGNIVFLGDIIVHGNVKEGMKVSSENSITIDQNVERAEIQGKGEIIIKGNVIASSIIGGGEDTLKIKEIEILNTLIKDLKALISAVEEIKNINILGYEASDGQIIKLLLESKFKEIYKQCLLILTKAAKNRDKKDMFSEKLTELLKSKLVGLAPLSIKHYSELNEILDLLINRMECLNKELLVPVNVMVSYCQDSIIESTGDVVVSGTGSIVSSISAHNNIYFTKDSSVVRGGTIKASSEIRAKIVGSHSGVITKLSVGESGHIWINTAFHNTVLLVGNREFTLEYPCRNVHAYLDDSHELTIDRLKL